jgi:hypothetical protein
VIFMPSVLGQILDAIETRLAAALPDLDTPTQIVERNSPEMVPGDPLPLVVYGPALEGETLEEIAMPDGLLYAYPITVAIFRAANRSLAVDREWIEFRQTVRDQLYRALNLPGGLVADWELSARAAFGQASREQTVQTTRFEVIYKVGEQRLAFEE